MTEQVKSLEVWLEDVESVINRLVQSNYSFAVWRLPQQTTTFLLISLQGEHPMESVHSLEDLNESFVLNSFHDAHPPTPLVIPGDLLIELTEDSNTIRIHPKVSADQLDRFIKDLKPETPQINSSNSIKSEIHPDYRAMVGKAVSAITSEVLQKVVLARCMDVPLKEKFSLYQTYQKLFHRYPNALVYTLNSKAHGLWMGATPEKLIAVDEGRFFSTDALAGTQPLGENQSLSDVGWTMKEIEEQAMVSRYIIGCFKKIRLREYEEIGPKTVKAGNLAHLKTAYKVDMVDTNSLQLASTMLDLLHPTSAVCGFPRDHSLAFIDANEGFDRGLYSGFIGPVNVAEKTNVFVNLRCMKIIGRIARLYAGAGITIGSHPDKEFDETELKMKTLLAVLEA